MIAIKDMIVKDVIANIDLVVVPSDWIWLLIFAIEFAWWFIRPGKYAEIAGMVGAISDDRFTMTEGVLCNVLYELQAFCTSVIAK